VEHAIRELSLSYGVFPYYQEDINNDLREYFTRAIMQLVENRELAPEDIICYLSGPISGNYGTTFMEINKVETMLKELNNYIIP
jgi:pyruvate kinase